jgi:hypothetical protein
VCGFTVFEAGNADEAITTIQTGIPIDGLSDMIGYMHRLPRWLVGTAASLLGLTLLLIREGFLLGGSRVVSAEGSPGKVRALLIAVQNEPAVLVYGAIAFLFLVGFALLISTAKWKRWVTGHKERKNS